jgi:hypothetical protein
MSLDYSFVLILPIAVRPWGRISSRNVLDGKELPMRKAENLTAICELIV